MKTIIRAGTTFAFLLWITLQASPLWTQNRHSNTPIQFGLTSSVIESDVNPNDALAAAKVWADLLGKGTGLFNSADARIFADAASALTAINSREADIIAMATSEYLDIEKNLQAVPSLTWVISGQVESQFLMLVRNDSGIQTIADLRNKRIAFPKGGRSTLIPLWLDVLLYENNLGEKESFFREIKQVQKTSQAILPIFFKQMDVGLIAASTYETAVALNPQIGRQLKVLATSPKLVTQVTCLPSTWSLEKRRAYIQAAQKLHETPGGLQGFQLFKLDRLVPWEPTYANNVRELMRKKKLAQSASTIAARSSLTAEAVTPK
jgi:phosphonate transport system substrate-binding protein